MFIGLLMVSHENDVLREVLAHNLQYVDAFYVLDGTVPNDESEGICRSFTKCAGYTTDSELPRPPFTEKPVCGYRAHIHDQAVAEHGPDHWFLVLHGDELWTFDPREVIDAGADGCVFPLPFYFPRAGEPWDDAVHPLQQLKWHLGPGYQEVRMFKGRASVGYAPGQTWDAAPRGLARKQAFPQQIKHYLYRSPDVQRARAARHVETGFDPDNYRHILDGDCVYWDDEMIARYQSKPFFANLGHD